MVGPPEPGTITSAIALVLSGPDESSDEDVTFNSRDAAIRLSSKNAILRHIEADPSATRLVIGHGALESTFITHIPALDDLGETSVAQKLAADHPGWLVTYSDNLDLTTQRGVPDHFTFTEEGKYFVLDSPSRQYLLLYQIQPK